MLHEPQRAHNQVRRPFALGRLELELHLTGGVELHPSSERAGRVRPVQALGQMEIAQVNLLI